MRRRLALTVSLLLFGAVLAPLTWAAGDDSYPLSSYPMFSHGRTSSEASITHVVAVGRMGERMVVPPHEIASSTVMQTLVTIQRSVDAGPASTKRFCRDIAKRLAASNDPRLRDSIAIEIETARIDAIAYLGGNTTPLTRTLHARCKRP